MLKPSHLLFLLAILKFLLPYFTYDNFYQPHRDEYLYLIEGRHLAWGFMEIPPLLSLFARTVHWLGDGFFWIKFWPNLFGSFTLVLAGQIAISLGGRHFAVILSSLPFLTGGYMRLFFLFQPNFLDVFFWTAIGYCLVRYFQDNNNVRWLYAFGACIGLGMMSKYSTAFYVSAIIMALAISPQRKIFINRHFYFAMLLGFAIFFPNLIWQYNHRFPVIHHMQQLQDEQLQFVGPVRFMMGQLLTNFASVFVWIAGWIFLSFSRAGKSFRFLGWAYVLVIVLLLYLHGKDYYALGAYPMLYAFGGYWLDSLTRIRLKWLRPVMIVAPILFGIFIFPLLLPTSKPPVLAEYFAQKHLDEGGGFQWEDRLKHPLPQDYADMIGWREMAEKTARFYKNLPGDGQKQTMIYCRGYFFAGALNFYGDKLGLPEVYSDNASFLFWMPDRYNVKNLLLVAHHIPEKDDIVFQQFQKMTIVDSLQDPLARENGVRLIYFENGNDQVNTLIEKSISTQKAKYKR